MLILQVIMYVHYIFRKKGEMDGSEYDEMM